MTVVLNLLGGPSSGKSTLAAELYAKMKHKCLKVEMVREVAKEWAWEGRKIGPFDQMAILGEQIKRESSLYGKVDYIVSDSPVMLGAFYFEYNHGRGFMNNMVKEYYYFAEEKGIKFVNIRLRRTKEYEQSGRFETLDEAIKIDQAIYAYISDNMYDCKHMFNNEAETANIILQELDL